MTGQRPPGRPPRGTEPMASVHIRIEKARWTAYTELHGNQAAERIRRYIEWDMREPGARLPERPPAAI